ncbi:hypothetical protein [uncultured Methanoregula sp.]|uniref:hypothetical protein n=1 Tax=uncultured Methanoregula sp. TaxID=1005933 RepID=UPI002AAA763D|nr:hypothetical protein [uncultured Methanoregula sp.]
MVRTVSRLVSKILAIRIIRGTVAAAQMTVGSMSGHAPNQNSLIGSLEYLTVVS